jgi:hypothetical protein
MADAVRLEYADPTNPARVWTVREVRRTRAPRGSAIAATVTLEFTSNGEQRLIRDVPVDWQKPEVLAGAFEQAEPTRDRFSFVHEGTSYQCEARAADTAQAESEPAKTAKRRSRAPSATWYVSAGGRPEVRTVAASADDLASMSNRNQLKERILSAVGARR